jgi:hypothetical protein
MKTETITMIKLTASEDKLLTNGETYGREIFLANTENAKNWYEITEEEYLKYQVEKQYYTGDNIYFEGENYVCIAPEGTVCVWSPKDYPAYWEKVK